MKKKILLFLMILLTFSLTGCNQKKEFSKTEIEEFIKTNMPGNWIYSEDKLKINDDKTIELIFNDMNDWAYCSYFTNNSIIALTQTTESILKSIPSITAICRNENNEDIAKAVYKSLYDITIDNIENKAKYYDSNNNIIDEDIKNTIKNECVTYKYSDILNDSLNYYKKLTKIDAEIVEFDEETILGIDYWILNVLMKNESTNTYIDEVLMILDKTIIKDKPTINDIYTFYGEIMATNTYVNENKEQITVPTVYILYADKNN